MAGNWKMNPTSLKESLDLAAGVAKLTAGASGVEVAVFPPHPFLVPVHDQIKNSQVKVGF